MERWPSWFKAQSWKDCLSEMVTRVRIPFSPFFLFLVPSVIPDSNPESVTYQSEGLQNC